MTEVLPRANSQNVAPMTMGQGLKGRPTERWQDKSREVRGRRLVQEPWAARAEFNAREGMRCALT